MHFISGVVGGNYKIIPIVLIIFVYAQISSISNPSTLRNFLI